MVTALAAISRRHVQLSQQAASGIKQEGQGNALGSLPSGGVARPAEASGGQRQRQRGQLW